MTDILEKIISFISSFDGDPLVLITILALSLAGCAMVVMYKVLKLIITNKA